MGIFFLTVGWQRYLCTKEMENFLVKRFPPKGGFCPHLCRCYNRKVVGISASFFHGCPAFPCSGRDLQGKLRCSIASNRG